MRRILVLLATVGVLAGAAVSSATAAPSDVKVSVGGQAQFVTPTTLLLPVTYSCPASFVSGFVSASVSQAETGATGQGFLPVPCTGAARTIVLTITTSGTNTYVLGPALANGFVSAGFQSDQNQRRIQIVL